MVPNADKPEVVLPAQIAIPWFKISRKLNINPVVSYSGVGLWNWCLIDENDEMDLNNLGCIHLFTGGFDEAWFYLVPLAIELKGGPALKCIIDAQRSIKLNDDVTILNSLKKIGDCIEEMTLLLSRMYEKCDPLVFWRRTRYYSGGSKNSTTFPNGVFYEGIIEVLIIDLD
jgi:indoleamine 2,3-dioxygenase